MTPLGIYIHVPFCAARCGYCDFNTYVPSGGDQLTAFVEAAAAELQHARAELGDRTVDTVFIGGGTPSLLGPGRVVALLDAVRTSFALRADAEITTEVNPESAGPALFEALQRTGVTRVSIGMQSAAGHVLATLDRVHTPGRAVAAAGEARAAGIRHVSLDLIYGTPGESDADWDASLTAALSAEPDHVSVYGLSVERGTALAAAVRRGRLPAPDDDAQARRYRRAEERLSAAGLQWYELASWARSDAARCAHNLGYWASADWWGVGPGAHSHVDGVRWWNVRRPHEYAQRLSDGASPAAGRERLTVAQRALEQLMLGLRTRRGLALDALDAGARDAAAAQEARGRLRVTEEGRLQLTLTGRLFADAVVRELAQASSTLGDGA